MPYYPVSGNPSTGVSRPRSFSAGSQQSVSMTGKKAISTGTSIKVIRVGSASKAYVKTKSPDENKGSGLSRYKTELCRPFQDYGYCKYGDKCQFAHGEHELRVVPRHPKYKTELCRTYHTRGFCPYGSRCHFIHNLDEARKQLQEGGTSSGGGPRSPNKTSPSFSIPISPSLDSGISSPDDILGYGRRFEFPPLSSLEQGSGSGSSGSGSDDDLDQSAFYDAVYSTEELSCLTLYDGGDGSALPLDQGSSPDPFMEFDVLSTGSGSPTKPVSDGFASAGPDVSELLGRMNLIEHQPTPPSPKSAHRLPVFDDMLNSKSDTALLEGVDSVSPFSLFPCQH